MIGWWAGLPPLLRFGVAGGILVIGIVLLLLGVWQRGLWAAGVGLVLLLFSFPNDAEKKGYQDF